MSYLIIIGEHGGKSRRTLIHDGSLKKAFPLAVTWSKLEKADPQISIGSVVLFSFNGFGPKRSVHVFPKLMIFFTTFC